MMLAFQPFVIGHLKYLTPQESQRVAHAMMLSTEYAEIINENFGLSAWVGSQCVAAAGCVPVFPHRAMGWAMISPAAAPYMLQIIRRTRSVMRSLSFNRIEISVAANYEPGHRFARAIGMKLETPEPLRMHGANGEDEYLYSMVKWRH